ncbi:hypothetical protein GT755_29040 [Herbidospora sp. NEAU-GS84]|uniref:Uncharacterized protein n=1 Tax=Herbidospora solisilvae TaxID=2696284 RepID=A0A7C9P242_9ACTN|nr:hypothetical protein [Herbidospora solisilvae]NAS25717.1 hypothetical protein [Herbidospora solisilvae]
MRITRGIITAALVVGTIALGSTPAHAIPPPPPGGDNLVVTSYYSGTQLVGQRWSGCNQPSGQWGVVTTSTKVSFVAC